MEPSSDAVFDERDPLNEPIAVLNALVITTSSFFIISFLLINPIAKRADIEVKAEFLITVFWPDNLEDDVDIYVEDPAGNLVWFKSREPGLMHLDRDDLGKRNDEVVTAAGTILFPENRETCGLLFQEWYPFFLVY